MSDEVFLPFTRLHLGLSRDCYQKIRWTTAFELAKPLQNVPLVLEKNFKCLVVYKQAYTAIIHIQTLHVKNELCCSTFSYTTFVAWYCIACFIAPLKMTYIGLLQIIFSIIQLDSLSKNLWNQFYSENHRSLMLIFLLHSLLSTVCTDMIQQLLLLHCYLFNLCELIVPSSLICYYL